MDASIVLALMILSHVITDFVLQTDTIACGKIKNFKIMDKHALHYFFTNLIFVFPYLSFGNNLWCIIIALTITHWMIDIKKVEYDKKSKNNGFESFSLDQLAHLCLICLSYPLIKSIELNIVATDVVTFFSTHYPILNLLTKQTIFIYILILASYIFNFKGATFITKKVLDKYLHLKDKANSNDPRKELVKQVIERYEFCKSDLNKENAKLEISINEKYDNMDITSDELKSLTEADDAKKNAGEAIGNLERLIILTLVLQSNYAAIGLVIAAKTVARYKKLEEKNFAEYYLIGTFTSLIIAVLLGEAILALKSI